MENTRTIDISSVPELAGAGLSVYEGWNEKIARDLVVASHQPHIMRNTPKDSLKRFTDKASADHWYTNKGHIVYCLYRGDAIAGIVWFADDERQDINAKHTFAIRLYQNAQGKGLSLPFMKIAHQDFLNKVGPTTIWLETDSDNTVALHLYKKFGYTKIDEKDGRITMVYTLQ